MDEKSREYIEKIGESANQLLEIMNDVLSVSRSETLASYHDKKSRSHNAYELYKSGIQKAAVSLDLNALYVLVVDDNPIEVEHARIVLEEVGINLTTYFTYRFHPPNKEFQSKLDKFEALIKEAN